MNSMNNCNQCNHHFTFLQIFKSFWFGYKPIKCENCTNVYNHTFKNRLLGGVSIGVGGGIGCFIMLNYNANFGLKLLLGAICILSASLLLSAILFNFFSFEKED